jgi:hypothetical protein
LIASLFFILLSIVLLKQIDLNFDVSHRIISELGNGVSKPYIDLSEETCGKKMCVNTGVQNFQW